jgi:exopolyphosphatase/pppGpp-phosphohydrolase
MTLPATVLHDFDRAKKAVGAALVWLHLGADTLWLVREGNESGAASMALDLGTDSTARLFFRSDLPRPQELERAIDHVEDELMRAVAWAAGRSVLGTDHALARGLTPTHGLTDAVLTRDAVEAAFQRLASGALGDPSALKGLPTGREVAAALLILRELMHHLGFSQVVVPLLEGASPA